MDDLEEISEYIDWLIEIHKNGEYPDFCVLANLYSIKVKIKGIEKRYFLLQNPDELIYRG